MLPYKKIIYPKTLKLVNISKVHRAPILSTNAPANKGIIILGKPQILNFKIKKSFL